MTPHVTSHMTTHLPSKVTLLSDRTDEGVGSFQSDQTRAICGLPVTFHSGLHLGSESRSAGRVEGEPLANKPANLRGQERSLPKHELSEDRPVPFGGRRQNQIYQAGSCSEVGQDPSGLDALVNSLCSGRSPLFLFGQLRCGF